MSAHEAVGMTDPVVLFDDAFHEGDEFIPLMVGMKDRHFSDTSAYDMIHGAWVLNT